MIFVVSSIVRFIFNGYQVQNVMDGKIYVFKQICVGGKLVIELDGKWFDMGVLVQLGGGSINVWFGNFVDVSYFKYKVGEVWMGIFSLVKIQDFIMIIIYCNKLVCIEKIIMFVGIFNIYCVEV